MSTFEEVLPEIEPAVALLVVVVVVLLLVLPLVRAICDLSLEQSPLVWIRLFQHNTITLYTRSCCLSMSRRAEAHI